MDIYIYADRNTDPQPLHAAFANQQPFGVHGVYCNFSVMAVPIWHGSKVARMRVLIVGQGYS